MSTLAEQQQEANATVVNPAHPHHAHMLQHATIGASTSNVAASSTIQSGDTANWPAYSNGFLDGLHSPQNVAFYSFCLGAVCMAGIQFIIHSTLPLQLSIYVAVLALFHFLEYFATALWNTHKVHLDCK